MTKYNFQMKERERQSTNRATFKYGDICFLNKDISFKCLNFTCTFS